MHEERILKENVLKVYNFLLENFECFELFVVDDGSADSTPKIVDELKDLIKVKGIRFLKYLLSGNL